MPFSVESVSHGRCWALLIALCLTGCKDDTKPSPPPKAQPATPAPQPASPPTPEVDSILPTPAPIPAANERKPEDEANDEEVQPPVEPRPRRGKPPGLASGEAANRLPLALYLADQKRYVGRKMSFRVTAESGNYFNCYYKGRRKSYHHLRLRGDGSAYLDAYLPRDPAGERLFTELQKRPRQLTVTVVARAETMTGACIGQVEILDFKRGFAFEAGTFGQAGALTRRITNQKDRAPARNRPRMSHYIDRRRTYIGKPKTFRVRARLDRYFQCKYSGTEDDFYAVFLQGDDFKGLRAYLPRNREGDALASWLAVNEGARLTATVVIPEPRYDELCPDQAEVVSWEKGWSR